MWRKEGDSSSLVPGAGPNRWVVYTPMMPFSAIIELKLVAIPTGGIIFTAKAATDLAYIQLKNAFVAAGFPEPSPAYAQAKGVMAIFKSDSIPRIPIFINILRDICNIDAIIEELNGYIASATSELPGAQILPGDFRARSIPHTSTYNFIPVLPLTPNHRTFFITQRDFRPYESGRHLIYARNSGPSVDIEANVRRLNELGWQGGWPKDYECAITHLLMTDPVFDLSCPSIKFERSVIERALDCDPRHPTTRVPLSKEQLVDDEELREEIRYFMQNIERAARIAGIEI